MGTRGLYLVLLGIVATVAGAWQRPLQAAPIASNSSHLTPAVRERVAKVLSSSAPATTFSRFVPVESMALRVALAWPQALAEVRSMTAAETAPARLSALAKTVFAGIDAVSADLGAEAGRAFTGQVAFVFDSGKVFEDGRSFFGPDEANSWLLLIGTSDANATDVLLSKVAAALRSGVSVLSAGPQMVGRLQGWFVSAAGNQYLVVRDGDVLLIGAGGAVEAALARSASGEHLKAAGSVAALDGRAAPIGLHAAINPYAYNRSIEGLLGTTHQQNRASIDPISAEAMLDADGVAVQLRGVETVEGAFQRLALTGLLIQLTAAQLHKVASKVLKDAEDFVTPRRGTLLVASNPPGAKIWLDGVELVYANPAGKTVSLPTDATIPGVIYTKPHHIKVALDGYDPEERRFDELDWTSNQSGMRLYLGIDLHRIKSEVAAGHESKGAKGKGGKGKDAKGSNGEAPLRHEDIRDKLDALGVQPGTPVFMSR